jgi:GrpB-like predicted nucleotidyltransferase (UPF0157 family)
MVEIVPYRHAWPEEFRTIAAQLRQALGPLGLRIDHIGSTSVPDLAAKDVIDIQVAVASLDDRVRSALTSAGYICKQERTDHRPPSSAGREDRWAKWLFVTSPGQRPAHVHVRVDGAANQRYALLFRDYLRSHNHSAQAYATLKRRLAQALKDPENYPEVKDPAVDLIYLAAEEWATRTGWDPGPSDA